MSENRGDQIGDGKTEPMFGGSVCDGLDVNLLQLVGLDDDEAVVEAFWEEGDLDILESCTHCRIVDDLDLDTGVPGGSDKYFSVWSDDKKAFLQELKEEILRRVTARQRKAKARSAPKKPAPRSQRRAAANGKR